VQRQLVHIELRSNDRSTELTRQPGAMAGLCLLEVHGPGYPPIPLIRVRHRPLAKQRVGQELCDRLLAGQSFNASMIDDALAFSSCSNAR